MVKPLKQHKIHRTMGKIFIIGLCFIGLVACKTQAPTYTPPVQIPVFTKEKVTERLVPYALPADSTIITALFECDSLNKVNMKLFEELKARGLISSFSFENGMLKFRLIQPPDTIYIQVTDTIIERDKPITYYIPSQPFVIYKQTDKQVVEGWFGKIFMCLLGLGSIIGVIVFIWKRKF